MRIYVQSEFFADVKLLEVNEETTFAQLRDACLALVPEEHRGADAQLFLEDEDEECPGPALDTPLKSLKKEHGTRVHLHRCQVILVEVHFGAKSEQHRFRPSATIGRVRLWAGRKFGMAPADIGEHVLQIAGTTEQPDIDAHVGAFTAAPGCRVNFDFVPAHRVNG